MKWGNRPTCGLGLKNIARGWIYNLSRKQTDRMRRLRSDLSDPGSARFCMETDISHREGKGIDRWIADRQRTSIGTAWIPCGSIRASAGRRAIWDLVMKPSYRANDKSDWTACDGRNRVRIYILECLFRLVVLLICQRASAANAFAPGCFCTDHPCLMHLLLPPFHHPALPLPHLLTAPVDTNTK